MWYEVFGRPLAQWTELVLQRVPVQRQKNKWYEKSALPTASKLPPSAPKLVPPSWCPHVPPSWCHLRATQDPSKAPPSATLLVALRHTLVCCRSLFDRPSYFVRPHGAWCTPWVHLGVHLRYTLGTPRASLGTRWVHLGYSLGTP